MSETITDHVAVDRFLAAGASAAMSGCDAWGADTGLDATVPSWRFRMRGVDAIRSEYARWSADPVLCGGRRPAGLLAEMEAADV